MKIIKARITEAVPSPSQRAEEFARDLSNIVEVARAKVVNLIGEYHEAEGLPWDTDQAMTFADDPNWQRQADGLAELGAWIHDRVNGRNRLHRRSMVKKIRKALGYTYP